MDAFWVKLKSFLCFFKHYAMKMKGNGSVTLDPTCGTGGVICHLDIWDCAHWLGGLIDLMVHRREHLWDWSYLRRCR